MKYADEIVQEFLSREATKDDASEFKTSEISDKLSIWVGKNMGLKISDTAKVAYVLSRNQIGLALARLGTERRVVRGYSVWRGFKLR